MDPDDASFLTASIADRAAGVFLWVRLVVRSLLTGFQNGDRLVDLARRLDELPDDLESLFYRILDNDDKFYFEHASQLIQNREMQRFRCQSESCPTNEIGFRLENMKRRLNSRCLGLLEAPLKIDQKVEDILVLAEAKVQYLHRTVKDFLEKPSYWEKLCKATSPNLSAQQFLAQMFLLESKTRNPKFMVPVRS